MIKGDLKKTLPTVAVASVRLVPQRQLRNTIISPSSAWAPLIPSQGREGARARGERIIYHRTQKKFWKVGIRGLVKKIIMDYFIYRMGG
jgi:hypothetical protein